jgi:hypothetical protein
MGATPRAREGARRRFSSIFGNRLCTRHGGEGERAEASQNDAKRNQLNIPVGGINFITGSA